MKKALTATIAALIVLTALAFSALPTPAQAVPPFAVAMDDLQVVGPFNSWANVKTVYGAVGDGVADDTAALQKALNAVGTPGNASVIYLPAGTYRITNTLTYTGPTNVQSGVWYSLELIGASPSTTKIVWNGPNNLPMLIQNGGYNARYSRITWEGSNTAGYGIVHWWNTSMGLTYDGSSEDTDEVFQNMGIGIMAGRMGQNYESMNSEGQIRRVTFRNNTVAGVDTGSPNALDWWIWDSQFIDCASGVSNLYSITDNPAGGTMSTTGAGNFMIYRSLFQGSTVADVNIGNTQWFSMHNNVSIGSTRFFQATGSDNDARIIIEKNRIVNTANSIAIEDDNLGPLILIDNLISSPAGQATPVVNMGDFVSGRDVISIGNSYNASGPIAFTNQSASDRAESIDDNIVASGSISTALPTLPPTPAFAANQTVFEVSFPKDCASPNMSTCASDIQGVINQAAASGAANPIVHFAAGNYYIDTTLSVPASTRIQILGDSNAAALIWNTTMDVPASTSTGPMILLNGPSLATVRDLQFFGNPPGSGCGTVNAISITNADQPNGRIFIEGSEVPPITANSLTQTELTMQANPSVAGINFNNVMNAVSIGQVFGPVSLANNSVALFEDSWYEGDQYSLYRMNNSGLHFLGGLMAPGSHPYDGCGTQPTPTAAIDINNTSGNSAFVAFDYVPGTGKGSAGTGIEIDTPNSNAYAMFMAAGSWTTPYIQWNGSTNIGNITVNMSKTVDSTGAIVQLPNMGNPVQSFLINSLSHIRNLYWESSPYTATAGSTDVRIYRIHAEQTLGLLINSN